MRAEADPALFAIWVRGWTLTRQAPPPDPVPGGWRIEANYPDHRWRFLYPAIDDAIAERARMPLPDRFALKVAAAAERVSPLLPPGWSIDGTTCMMTSHPRADQPTVLPDGYRLSLTDLAPGVVRAEIFAPTGELAAAGHVGFVEDVAIYDRIRTQDPHQRRGLGRALMAALGEKANAAGAKRWMLAATAAGRALYTTLGWEVHAPYTTAIIPLPADPAP